jgi:hypothetical protein
MKIHESITTDRIMKAVERHLTSLDSPGFCTACGAEAEECEPDMEGGECEMCGEAAVYGAEQLLIMTA